MEPRKMYRCVIIGYFDHGATVAAIRKYVSENSVYRPLDGPAYGKHTGQIKVEIEGPEHEYIAMVTFTEKVRAFAKGFELAMYRFDKG